MASKKSKKKEEFESELHEFYGYLNEKKNKCVAMISWGDNAPKVDIRKCYTNKEGELVFSTGITLNESELEALSDMFKYYRKNGRFKPHTTDGKESVDLDEYIDEASDIIDKREKKNVTEDGFIKLTRR